MKLTWLLLIASLPAAACADGAEPLPIADAARDPAWRDLADQLAPGRTRECAFEERRYFPFRREPIVLTGEIRIAPGRGLSLRYLTPNPYVLIADSQGLLMRDATGRDRSPPDDPRARAAIAALVDVLGFDLPGLEKSFILRGAHQGDHWTLSFSARDRALAADLGTLVLTGWRTQLQKIEMIRSANRHIDILIGDTQENVVFTTDTLSRFFR
jgi:hypothetical protein